MQDVNDLGGAHFDDSEPFDVENDSRPERPPSVLDGLWRTVEEWGAEGGEDWLQVKPPRRRYLLSTKFRDGKQATEPAGVLPLGRVGMLAAGGGCGKSWALIQLALSVATGRDWLDTFEINAPVGVVLLLGEEEAEETRRRLYKAARMLELSPQEQKDAAANILAVPLCGKQVALTYSPEELRNSKVDPSSAEAIETPFARELRDRLDSAGVEWRLVVVDPLSRFAGPDVEADNAAATRLVQCLERMTEARGNPTLLVSHHKNKGGLQGATNASAARGSSALTDGVRWQANLDSLPNPRNPRLPEPNLVELRASKSNYGVWWDDLMLHRDRNYGGALRPATKMEIEQYEEDVSEADIERAARKKATSTAANKRAGSRAGNGEDDEDSPASLGYAL